MIDEILNIFYYEVSTSLNDTFVSEVIAITNSYFIFSYNDGVVGEFFNIIEIYIAKSSNNSIFTIG
ncbi:hypothetical protein D3C81_1678420 [compost metagenome]